MDVKNGFFCAFAMRKLSKKIGLEANNSKKLMSISIKK
jgi:hypothetical protein